MDFTYTKECNIYVGQELFGIIAVSIYTYDGVYPINVHRIDYNNECVIFRIKQPCIYVSCTFEEMKSLVFRTEAEAKWRLTNGGLEFGAGLTAHGPLHL